MQKDALGEDRASERPQAHRPAAGATSPDIVGACENEGSEQCWRAVGSASAERRANALDVPINSQLRNSTVQLHPVSRV